MIFSYRDKLNKEKDNIIKSIELEIKERQVELELLAASQRKNFEHTFHQAMEDKKVELAKLDALIKAKELSMEVGVKAFEAVISEQKQIIEVLKETIKGMAPVTKTALSIKQD